MTKMGDQTPLRESNGKQTPPEGTQRGSEPRYSRGGLIGVAEAPYTNAPRAAAFLGSQSATKPRLKPRLRGGGALPAPICWIDPWWGTPPQRPKRGSGRRRPKNRHSA